MLQQSWKEEWSDFRIIYGIPFLLVIIVSLAFDGDPDTVSGAKHGNLGHNNNFIGFNFDNPVPAEYKPLITSGYGERIHPVKKIRMMHRGVDISVPKGTPVTAAADGQVVHVEENWVKGKNYGRYIVVSHADNFATLYAQLSCYKVSNGQFVKKGDIIGEVGRSGISTGNHLHYEIKKDGEYVDPMLFMKK